MLKESGDKSGDKKMDKNNEPVYLDIQLNTGVDMIIKIKHKIFNSLENLAEDE